MLIYKYLLTAQENNGNLDDRQRPPRIWKQKLNGDPQSDP